MRVIQVTALVLGFGVLMSACTHSSSEDIKIPAELKGEGIPVSTPVKAPVSKSLVDLKQCPTLSGKYVNRDFGVDFVIEATRAADGLLTLNIDGNSVVINGLKQSFKNGATAEGTCEDFRVKMTGVESNGKAYYHIYENNLDTGILTLNIMEPSSPALFKGKMRFRSR